MSSIQNFHKTYYIDIENYYLPEQSHLRYRCSTLEAKSVKKKNKVIKDNPSEVKLLIHPVNMISSIYGQIEVMIWRKCSQRSVRDVFCRVRSKWN